MLKKKPAIPGAVTATVTDMVIKRRRATARRGDLGTKIEINVALHMGCTGFYLLGNLAIYDHSFTFWGGLRMYLGFFSCHCKPLSCSPRFELLKNGIDLATVFLKVQNPSTSKRRRSICDHLDLQEV